MVNSETGAAALTNEGGTKKTMTAGELTILILAIGMTLLSILVAAKAYTAAYSFHASIFAIASIAAIFALFERYRTRQIGSAHV